MLDYGPVVVDKLIALGLLPPGITIAGARKILGPEPPSMLDLHCGGIGWSQLRVEGAFFWRHLWRGTEDAIALAHCLWGVFNRDIAPLLEERVGRELTAKTAEDTVERWMWQTLWAEHAFPILHVGTKLATALAFTRGAALPVRMPWAGIGIAFPPRLLSAPDADYRYGGLFAATMRTGERFGLSLCSDNGVHIWEHSATGVTLTDFLTDEEPVVVENMEHIDRRLVVTAKRVILGLLTAMEYQPPEIAVDVAGKGLRTSSDPEHREVAFSSRISLPKTNEGDLAGWIETGRCSARWQYVVRGHWRRQACGPSHQERRLTWIRPHWRGADGAPLLRHDYAISDDSQE